MKKDFLDINLMPVNVLDDLSESIVIYDFDMKPVYINDATVNLSGYSKTEIMNSGINHFFPDSDIKTMNEIMGKLKNSDETMDKVFLFYKKNKELARAKTKIKKIKIGGKDYILINWQDMTREKFIDADLLKQKNSSQNFFDLVGLFIVAIDKDQNITLINKKAGEILGYEKDQVIGKNWFDNFIPKNLVPKVKEVFNQLMQGKIEPVEKYQNYIITKYKEKKLISWTNTVIKDEKGNILGTLSCGEDATDTKKIESEREDLIMKLAKSKKETEEFIYTVGHDLKSPLVNIQGFSNELTVSIQEITEFIAKSRMDENLREKLLDKIKKEFGECLEYINLSSNKMISLINGLLKLSKIGFVKFNFNIIDMNNCIKEVIDLFKFKISEKNLKLSIGNLPECYGDETYINQALSNLVDNSIKYLTCERPGEIKISGHRQKNFSVYTIEDNGIGIPDYFKEKIFNLFFRTNQVNTTGDGLGLAIVKKIIEIHNGKIEFESVENQGTKFIIYIPGKLMI